MTPATHGGQARQLAERRAAGIFYTPAALARAIVDRLLRATGELGEAPLVLDPSCGEGVFLEAVAERLPRAHLVGIDNDPRALELARQRVPRLEAVLGDSLDPAVGPAAGSVDLLVGNPPFVRCRSLPAARRAELRRLYSTARGLFNLAVPFVERSLAWLRPGARLALVLPNKLLVAGYGSKLRALLCEQTEIEEVIDLAEDDPFAAAAYPIILTLRGSLPGPGQRTLLLQARLENGGWQLLAQRSVAQSVEGLAAPAFHDPLVDLVLEQGFPPLGELFRLREGLHTGNVRALLLRDAALLPSDRPVLRGRDCGRYRLAWAGLWVATDPGLLDRSRGEYASFPDPRIFEGPKLLLREISPRPAACLDLEGHWTLNKVYPLQELRTLDSQGRLACLGLLNSAPFFRVFSGMFRATQLRGRHLQFKAQYVHRMPMPPPDALLRAGLGELTSRRIKQGAVPGLEEALDRAAEEAYGLRRG